MNGLDTLEQAIGYRFRKRDLLLNALTHGSYANEHPEKPSNERMEFLGDAVLGMLVSEMLYRSYPNLAEGPLTARKARIVGAVHLAAVARRIDLGSFILVGYGEKTPGGPGASMLADCMEAIVAAVLLDGGVRSARALVSRLFGSAVREKEQDLPRDWKSELQARAIGMSGELPRYRLMSESGPDHCKQFRFEVSIKDGRRGTGQGPSKKLAQQQAARSLLEQLNFP
jgi:ribonuclease-3